MTSRATASAGGEHRAGAGEERPPLLRARSLTVRFGPVVALDRLDLTAPAGEVLAVLGPNGAGKTTLVRTVATLLRPSGGDLHVLGRDVVRDPLGVRRSIGLAGQAAAVEPVMTGRENLEMVARLFGHDGPGARRAAGAVIDRLGLGEVADRRCATYSGGQRRRLDLGASLVGAPRVLLLDEPTTGLDPAGRREVWDTVRALVAAGTDVVLTTHYLEEADALADQVVVIDRGRAVAAGPVGRLKASVGLDVIEVVVGEADALARAAAVLDGVTGRAARVDRAGRRATVPSTAGTGQLSDVARALDQAGVAVEGVALRRPTLDEVFLALTGGGEAA